MNIPLFPNAGMEKILISILLGRPKSGSSARRISTRPSETRDLDAGNDVHIPYTVTYPSYSTFSSFVRRSASHREAVWSTI
jgi:hypothetical protein